MSNPLRRLDFWLISLAVASLVAFGAQRWGWGQIRKVTTTVSVGDITNDGASEDDHLVCVGTDPNCVPTWQGQGGSAGADWKFSASDTCGVNTPASGRWSTTESFPFTTATQVCIANLNDNGLDMKVILSSLAAGSTIYIQRTSDSSEAVAFQTTGAGVDNTTYFNFPVAFQDSTGSSFSNNAVYAIQFFQANALQTFADITGTQPNAQEIFPFFDLYSGILTGGVVTVNGGDPAKFDVSAGTGVTVDWSDPTDPQTNSVAFGPFTAVTITDIATTAFTSLTIDSTGTLLQSGGTPLTQQQHRSEIRIEGLVHTDNATITDIGTDVTSAFQKVEAVLDYIRFIGPANRGNLYGADAATLALGKSSGQTALPFINFRTDSQNPSIQSDAAQSPVSSIVYSYSAGGGSFPQSAETLIDPDNYAPAGTLIAVPNNRWTIQRIYFFPQTGSKLTIVEYGQVAYMDLAEAQEAFSSEAHVSDPNFAAGSFTTVLFIEEGATDLSDALTAVFQPL